MTLTQNFRNGIWTMHSQILTGEADVNFYRVAAGVYAWEDSISPSDYTAVKRGLALGVAVVPGAWTGPADTDGMDVHYRTQSGGADAGSNPRGGDILFELGAKGAGGSGRGGCLSCPPLAGTGERFGLGALGKNTGQGNTAFGYNAAAAVTTGEYITAVGHSSGSALISGASNTFLGYSAGISVTTGAENVIVGSDADVINAATTQSVAIGKVQKQRTTQSQSDTLRRTLQPE